MKKISVIIPLDPSKEPEFIGELQAFKNLEIIVEKGPNTSQNRNKGIKKAKTQFIAFINAHTTIAKDWDKQILAFFAKHPEVDIVGGPQHTFEKDNYLARVSGYAVSSIFGAAAVRNRYAGKKFKENADEEDVTSANLICRRKVFSKVLFDETIYPGEDPKFIHDAKQAGFCIAYSPDIIAFNRRRPTLSQFTKQIFTYGKVRPQKESLKDTLKKPYFLVPSLFLIYLFLLFFASLFSYASILTGNGNLIVPFFFIFSFPLLLYILLEIYFSAYNSLINRDFFSFFLLPVIFLTIHISYGLGFFMATFRKIRR